MNTATIFESFILPSKGLIYDKEVNPQITLRSMTTMEEMKRLSPTETPYKVMSDIIEACMQEKPAIPVYDMSLGDYQFLLHKIRIVSYGPEYKMLIKCNECGQVTESIADLDSLEVHEFTPDIIKQKMITLPKTKKQIFRFLRIFLSGDLTTKSPRSGSARSPQREQGLKCNIQDYCPLRC